MEASALSAPAGLGRLTVAGPLLRLRTDDQLVALFRAGHDEAFGAIHERYRQRLFAYARQMLGGSRSDAEDALQDVFLRAYHALRVDDRPVTLRAWLYRVAHNRCIDQLRRPVPAPSDVFELNRTPLHDPLVEAERREDLRRLVEDVRRLPEQQRSALLMREMEGLSYAELAAALGVSVPAVKSLLVRARIGLVEAIEARDTACGEIREDLVEAHGRGVRASGRARRHLRECAGCQEYRVALRGLDRALQGLSPAGGPLAALAKLLGAGGAGSGAAAASGGGSAVVASSGILAGSASKVVAVVAAAAVVGGGAAEVQHRVVEAQQTGAKNAGRHAAPLAAAPERVAAPIARVAAAVAVAPRRAVASRGAAPTKPERAAKARRDGAAVAPAIFVVEDGPVLAASEAPALANDVEAAAGGTQAPAVEPEEPAATGTPSGTAGTGTQPSTATPGQQQAGTQTSAQAGSGTGPSQQPMTGTTSGAGGSSASSTGTPGPISGPTGQSTGGPAPVAQGATAQP